MKHLAQALVALSFIAGTLGGFAQAQKATDYLAAPKTAQAVANLRSLAMAFDCGLVVAGAALSGEIAGIVDAGQAAVGTTGRIYAVSAAICTALGGAPSSAPVKVR